MSYIDPVEEMERTAREERQYNEAMEDEEDDAPPTGTPETWTMGQCMDEDERILAMLEGVK